MPIHVIPGKLEVQWDSSVRAIIDIWTDYNVTLEEFKDAVLEKGLSHAKASGARAWIVDSSKAEGNFTKECQGFIASDLFPAFAANGIKYFITIKSGSALTNISIKSYSAKAGPSGIQLVEVPSVDAAREWLKSEAE
jgi:hypothetical protein